MTTLDADPPPVGVVEDPAAQAQGRRGRQPSIIRPSSADCCHDPTELGLFPTHPPHGLTEQSTTGTHARCEAPSLHAPSTTPKSPRAADEGFHHGCGILNHETGRTLGKQGSSRGILKDTSLPAGWWSAGRARTHNSARAARRCWLGLSSTRIAGLDRLDWTPRNSTHHTT
nr:unnamed protein product [Digitaria exilis]